MCANRADPARWSFGGNRLQIKAETRLIADVDAALRSVSSFFAQPIGNLQSLSTKQDLLSMLLGNEQTRLIVWLYPLDHEKRHIFSSGNPGKSPPEVCRIFRSMHNIIPSNRFSQATLSAALKTAWAENPKLAVQLTGRFASTRLADEVRALLLRYPELAIEEPDALHILIGPSLPTDVSSQLKVSGWLMILIPTLRPTVLAILGTGQPHHGRHLLLTRV